MVPLFLGYRLSKGHRRHLLVETRCYPSQIVCKMLGGLDMIMAMRPGDMTWR